MITVATNWLGSPSGISQQGSAWKFKSHAELLLFCVPPADGESVPLRVGRMRSLHSDQKFKCFIFNKALCPCCCCWLLCSGWVCAFPGWVWKGGPRCLLPVPGCRLDLFGCSGVLAFHRRSNMFCTFLLVWDFLLLRILWVFPGWGQWEFVWDFRRESELVEALRHVLS